MRKLCVILHHLYKFKNVKKHSRRSIFFSYYGANGTKSLKASHFLQWKMVCSTQFEVAYPNNCFFLICIIWAEDGYCITRSSNEYWLFTFVNESFIMSYLPVWVNFTQDSLLTFSKVVWRLWEIFCPWFQSGLGKKFLCMWHIIIIIISWREPVKNRQMSEVLCPLTFGKCNSNDFRTIDLQNRIFGRFLGLNM